MLEFIPSTACHREQFGAISVISLFSFNNYFDPRNAGFGSLLVFNDYRVPPAAGFKMHPHPNCEQLFFVLEGRQKCSDTLGNSVILAPVSAQRVTAGTGYARETSNCGNSVLRFMSVRFQPREAHSEPRHEVRSFPPALLRNRVLKVASGLPDRTEDVLLFDADAEVAFAALEQKPHSHAVAAGMKTLVYVLDGCLELDGQSLRPGEHPGAEPPGQPLSSGDHLRIIGPETVTLSPAPKARLMFIDMH